MEAEKFASEAGGTWRPLAPSTQRERARKGYGPAHPILEQTGRLAASVMGGEGHVRRETPMSITLGTEVPYAVFHQRGTQHMPARMVIGHGDPPRLQQREAQAVRKLFSEYLHKVITSTWDDVKQTNEGPE